MFLKEYLPTELFDRPKKGFGIPLNDLLRGPLYTWADDHLSRDSLIQVGLLKPEIIEKVWREHQNNQRNWGYWIWDVVMLQAWMRSRKVTLN